MAPKDQVSSIDEHSPISPHKATPKAESYAQTAPIIVQTGNQASPIQVADARFLLGADYQRHGDDLVLLGKDGREIVLKGYFETDSPPDLVASDNGATVNAHLATTLAGPLAPGQYAQAGGDNNVLGAPIGKVESASGEVRVKHADGTAGTLRKGDAVYQSDQINTSVGSSTGLTMADGSALSLGEGSRMVLDDMIYDPSGNGGNATVEVMKGAVTFVSGQISKTNPDAFNFQTPVTNIGIRGTAGGISVGGDGATTAGLIAEAGGTGELSVGGVVLNQPGVSSSVSAAGGPPSPPAPMSSQQFGQMFGSALAALPGAAQHIEAAVLQQATQAFQQQQQMQQQMQQLQQQQSAAKAAAVAAAADAPPPGAELSAAALNAQVAKAVAMVQMQAQMGQIQAQMMAQQNQLQAIHQVINNFQNQINNEITQNSEALAAVTTLVTQAESTTGVTVSHQSVTPTGTSYDATGTALNEYSALQKVISDYQNGSYSQLSSDADKVSSFASSIQSYYDQAVKIAHGSALAQSAVNDLATINDQAKYYLSEAEAIASAASDRVGAAAKWLSGEIIVAQVSDYNTYLSADAGLTTAETAQQTAATNAANQELSLLQPLIDQASAQAADSTYLTALQSAMGNFLTAVGHPVSSSPTDGELIGALNAAFGLTLSMPPTATEAQTWSSISLALTATTDGSGNTVIGGVTLTPVEAAWYDGYVAAYTTWSSAETALDQANASLASAEQLYNYYVSASLNAQDALTQAQLSEASAVATAAAANTAEEVAQEIAAQSASNTMTAAASSAQSALTDAGTLINTINSLTAKINTDAVSNPGNVHGDLTAIQSAVNSLTLDEQTATSALSSASYALNTLSAYPPNIAQALANVYTAASTQLTDSSLAYDRIAAFASQIQQDYVTAEADLTAASQASTANSSQLLSLMQQSAFSFYKQASVSLQSLDGSVSGSIRAALNTDITGANTVLSGDSSALATAQANYGSLNSSILGNVSLSGLTINIEIVDASIINVPGSLTLANLASALNTAQTAVSGATNTLHGYTSLANTVLSHGSTSLATALADYNAAAADTSPGPAAQSAQDAQTQAQSIALSASTLSTLRTSVSLLSSTYSLASSAVFWASAALDYQSAVLASQAATATLGQSNDQSSTTIHGQSNLANNADNAINHLYNSWNGNPDATTADATALGQLQTAESNAQSLLNQLSTVLSSANSAASSLSSDVSQTLVDYAATALLAQSGSALAAAQAEYETATYHAAVVTYGNDITAYETQILSDYNSMIAAQTLANKAAGNLSIAAAVQSFTNNAASLALHAQSAGNDSTTASNLVQQYAQAIFTDLANGTSTTNDAVSLAIAEQRVLTDYTLAQSAVTQASAAVAGAASYASANPLSLLNGTIDTSVATLLTAGSASLTAALTAESAALAAMDAVQSVYNQAFNAASNSTNASLVISAIYGVVAANSTHAGSLAVDAATQASNATGYYNAASASLTSLIASIALAHAADFSGGTLTAAGSLTTEGSLYVKAEALLTTISGKSSSIASESATLHTEYTSLLSDSSSLSSLASLASPSSANQISAQNYGTDANVQFQGSGTATLGIVSEDQLMQLNAKALLSAENNASALSSAYTQYQTNAATQATLTALAAIQTAETAVANAFTISTGLASGSTQPQENSGGTSFVLTPSVSTLTNYNVSGVAISQSVTVASASAATGQVQVTNGTLYYSPTSYYHGTDTITLSAVDVATIAVSGTTQTLSTTASGQITITVQQVETGSTLTAMSASVALGGVGNLSSTIAGAYVSPDSTSLGEVEIMSLPTQGALTLNGAAVSAGELIAAGLLGELNYTASSKNAFGDSFTLESLDSYGMGLSANLQKFSALQTVSISVVIPTATVSLHSFALSSVASNTLEQVVGTGNDTFDTGVSDGGTIYLNEAGQTGTLVVSSMNPGGFMGAYQYGDYAILQLTAGGGGGQMILDNQFSTANKSGISEIISNGSNYESIVGAADGIVPGTLSGTTGDQMILANLGEAVVNSGTGSDQFFLGGGNQAVTGYNAFLGSNYQGGKAEYVEAGTGYAIAYKAQAPSQPTSYTTTGSVTTPSVINLAGGGYEDVWYDAHLGYLVGQQYNAADVAIGGVTNLASIGIAGSAYVSAQAGFALTSGTGFEVIVESSPTPTGTLSLEALTVELGSSITITTATVSSSVALSSGLWSTPLSTGSVAVIWSDGANIYQETVAVGATSGGAVTTFATAATSHTLTDVREAVLSNGSMVVTWADNGIYYIEESGLIETVSALDGGINLTKVRITENGSGLLLGGFDAANNSYLIDTVNSSRTVTNSQFIFTSIPASNMSIRELTGGGYVMDWGGGTKGLYAEVFDSSGNPASQAFEVVAPSASTLSAGRIAALSNGNFVLSWSDGINMYSEDFSADGNPVGAVALTNGVTTYNDTLFAIDKIGGTSGNDSFTLGAGQMTFEASAGNDIYNGASGLGGNTVTYENIGGPVTMTLGTLSTDIAVKGAAGLYGTDTLLGVTTVVGSGYADTIAVANFAAGANVTIYGGGGADVLSGGTIAGVHVSFVVGASDGAFVYGGASISTLEFDTSNHGGESSTYSMIGIGGTHLSAIDTIDLNNQSVTNLITDVNDAIAANLGYGVTKGNANLVIQGNDSDTLTLDGIWTEGASVNGFTAYTGMGSGVYTGDTVTLLVSSNLAVGRQREVNEQIVGATHGTTTATAVNLNYSLADPTGTYNPGDTYTLTGQAGHGSFATNYVPTTVWTTSLALGAFITSSSQSVSATANGLELIYAANSSLNGGLAASTFNYTTTATLTGTQVLVWNFSGDNAWSGATAGLTLIENGVVDGTALVTPNISNVFGNFTFSGTTTLSVTAGETYGFQIYGFNSDSNSFIGGSLTIESASVAMQTSTALGNSFSLTGTAATLNAELSDLSYVSNPGYDGTDTIATTLQDTSLGNGVSNPVVSQDFGVTVNPAPSTTVSDNSTTITVTQSNTAFAFGALSGFTLTGNQPLGGFITIDGSSDPVYNIRTGFTGVDTFTLTNSGTLYVETVTVNPDITIDNQGIPLTGALSYNGSQIASLNGGFNVGVGDFSIEGWVNPSTIGGTQVINAENAVGNATQVGFVTELINGKVTFILTDPNNAAHPIDIQDSTALTVDQWAHVAVTRSGSVYTLYVNGVAAGSADAGYAANIDNPYPFTIGGQLNGAGTAMDTATAFHGQTASGSLWTTALPAWMIASPQNLNFPAYSLIASMGQLGLYATWTQPTASIPTGQTELTDLSGHENTLILGGNLGGAPSLQLLPPAALTFTGSDSITVGTINNSVAMTAATVSAWVLLPDNSTTVGTIVSVGTTTVAGAGVALSINGSGQLVATEGGQTVTSTAAVTDGLWHYFTAAVNPAGTITLLEDGNKLSTTLSGTAASISIAASAPMTIGSGLVGEIADVGVWGYKQNTTAVQTAMDTTLTGSEWGLVSLYRLDGYSTTSQTIVDSAFGATDTGTIAGAAPTVTYTAAPVFSSGVPAMENIGSADTFSTSGTVTVTNPNADTLSYSVADMPMHGTLTLAGDVFYTYTPTLGYVGGDAFSINVYDATTFTTIRDTVAVAVISPISTIGVITATPYSTGYTTFNGTGPIALASPSTLIASLNLNSAYTIGEWIRTTETSAGYLNFIGDIGQGIDLLLYNGRLEAQDTGGDSAISLTNVNDGQWHYIAATYSGSTISLYVDGALSATSALSTLTLGSTYFDLGGMPISSAYYVGDMAQVSIINTSLSLAQVDSLMVAASPSAAGISASNLVAYLPMNTNNSGYLNDASGNGNSVALGSAATVESYTSFPNTTIGVAEHSTTGFTGSLTATDATGTNVSWSLSSSASLLSLTTADGGTVTLTSGGTFTYTNTSYFSGIDSFTVTATDSNGATASQVIDVDVINAIQTMGMGTTGMGTTGLQTGVTPITALAKSGMAVTGVIAATDSLGTVTASLVGSTATTHGAVHLAYNSTLAEYAYTYTSNSGFVGVDSFTVALTDGNSGSVAADQTIYVDVAPNPSLPNATVSATSETTLNLATGGLELTGEVYGGNFYATLSVQHGLLNVVNSNEAVVTGNDTGLVFISGSYDSLESALQSVVYTPYASYAAGTDTLSETLASGGELQMPLGSFTAAITVTDPAPVVAAANFLGNSYASTSTVSAQVTNITVEATVNWTNSGTAGFIFYNGDSSYSGYGLQVTATGALSLLAGRVTFATSTATLTAGQWEQVALVNNAGAWSVYVNGVQYSFSSSPTAATASGNTSIGAAWASSTSFNGAFIGQIAQVAFWNNARSLTQIAADATGISLSDSNLAADFVMGSTFGGGSQKEVLNLANHSTNALALSGVSFDGQQTILAVGGAAVTAGGQIAAMDLAGNAVTYSVVQPTYGTASINSAGTITFNPIANGTIWYGTENLIVNATGTGGTTTDTIALISAQHDYSISSGGTVYWSANSTLSGAGAFDEIAISGSSWVIFDTGLSATILGASVSSSSDMEISHGTLALGATSYVDVGSGLYVDPSGVLSVAAGATVIDNGYFGIAGGTIAGLGTVEIANAFTDSSQAFTVNGNLDFIGTVGNTNGFTDGVNIYGSGAILNDGLFTFSASTLEIDPTFVNGSQGVLAFSTTGETVTLGNTLTNAGTISESGAMTDSLTDLVSVVNSGTISSDGGYMYVTAPVIDNAETGIISASSTGHVGLWVVGAFTNEGTIDLSGGSLGVTDTDAHYYTQMTNTGLIEGAISGGVNPTIYLTGASLYSNGTIEVGQGAEASASMLTISGGNVELGTSSELILHAGSVGYDQLDVVSGSLTLGGTLDVMIDSSPAFIASSPIPVLEGTLLGSFQTIEGLYDPSNETYVLDPIFSSTGLTLTRETTGGNLGFGALNILTGQYLIAGQDGETLIGSGSGDVLIGQSNTTISIANTNFHFIDGGGGGFNKLVWQPTGTSNTTMDLSSVLPGLVENIQEIDLSRITGATVTLDTAHVQAMTQPNLNSSTSVGSLYVMGLTNEHVTFTDSGWSTTGTTQTVTTPDGHADSYTVYTNSNNSHVQVLVEHNMGVSHV